MEFADALARRRSCRSYLSDPVDDAVVDRVLGAALRGPTAGNSWGIDLVVLRGEDTWRYWDVTLATPSARESFRWPGLLRAAVLVVVVVDPGAYLERYAEPDKARAGLGGSLDAWPVPYWWVDGGAAVMAILLAATSEGLGSLLFGTFGHAPALAETFGIPDGREILGCVALGHPAREEHQASASATRGRPGLDGIVHRDHW